jgi:hypothetical protein
MRGNLLAMFIDDLNGIISASYDARRDGHHQVFCPLIIDVSENEHCNAEGVQWKDRPTGDAGYKAPHY